MTRESRGFESEPGKVLGKRPIPRQSSAMPIANSDLFECDREKGRTKVTLVGLRCGQFDGTFPAAKKGSGRFRWSSGGTQNDRVPFDPNREKMTGIRDFRVRRGKLPQKLRSIAFVRLWRNQPAPPNFTPNFHFSFEKLLKWCEAHSVRRDFPDPRITFGIHHDHRHVREGTVRSELNPNRPQVALPRERFLVLLRTSSLGSHEQDISVTKPSLSRPNKRHPFQSRSVAIQNHGKRKRQASRGKNRQKKQTNQALPVSFHP